MKTATTARISTLIGAAMTLCVSGLARAHHFMDGTLPQTFVQGLLSGLGHPLIGVDHAAFIVAAGFVLARVAGGLWGVGALIVGSLIGAALHLAGFALPGGEIGVALSLMLIGGLVLARRAVGLSWLAGGLAVAGLLHGYAYAESIFGAEPTPLGAYLIGFSVIQFGIAAATLLVHRWLLATHDGWTRPVCAGLGTVVSAIGITFLVLNLLE